MGEFMFFTRALFFVIFIFTVSGFLGCTKNEISHLSTSGFVSGENDSDVEPGTDDDDDGDDVVVELDSDDGELKMVSGFLKDYINDLKISGNVIFAAAGVEGLKIVDISSPSTPVTLSVYTGDFSATKIRVNGNYVYVSASGNKPGVYIFDATDTLNPLLLSYLKTENSVLDLVYVSNKLYIAESTVGVRVLDISIPSSPQVIGSYVQNKIRDLDILGTNLFITDQTDDLVVLDITDPTSPSLVIKFDTTGSSSITIDSGKAYIGTFYNGIEIVDITTPSAPVSLGTYNTPRAGVNILVIGTTAYVSDQSKGLLILDVSNPASITSIGSYDTDGLTYAVEVSGGHAYLADKMGGIKIIDISTPTSPTLTKSFNEMLGLTRIVVSGDYVYGANSEKLIIFDKSDINNISKVSELNLVSSTLKDIAIRGDYVYVAAESAGVHIVNISNPASPIFIKSFDPGSAKQIQIVGDYMYVAGSTGGLHILDMRDPENLIIVSTTDTREAETLKVADDILYLADYWITSNSTVNGLRIYNVSDPALPDFLGTVSVPDGKGYGVEVANGYAFISGAWAWGLHAIDVSSLTAPSYSHTFDFDGITGNGVNAHSIAVDSKLYVPSAYHGVQELDITDPTKQILLRKSNNWENSDIAIDQNYLYTVNGEGLRILKL